MHSVTGAVPAPPSRCSLGTASRPPMAAASPEVGSRGSIPRPRGRRERRWIRVTHEVTFRVDLDARCTPRRVWFHLRDFGADPTFHLEGDQWVARIPRPPVDRLEYLLVLEWADGSESMVTDPANPQPGPHGVRRQVGRRVPGLRAAVVAVGRRCRGRPGPPGRRGEAAAARRAAMTGRRTRGSRRWLAADVGAGHARAGRRGTALDAGRRGARHATEQSPGEGVSSVRVRTPYRGSDERIRRSPAARSHPAGALVVDPGTAEVVDPEAAVAVVGQLHVPADSTPDEPLPLLVVHDGPEYADLAQLLRYVTTLARIEPALRCRVLLLAAHRPRPQLLGLTRLRPGPGHPDAAQGHRRGGHRGPPGGGRGQPRRAGDAARGQQLPGHLRRGVQPVRVVLPAAHRRDGARLPPLQPDRALRRRHRRRPRSAWRTCT